ncbi:MAG: ABC transporter ATP-binding protein [Alphaproteobacteria bacterium]|nr:ABC transporter ATP-binding protein [Alphaproteobacteria bacterium]
MAGAGEGIALRFEGIHKSFGSHHVLRGLDLAIPTGQLAVIIGRSGTGKSVTLKHAMGLLQPDAGHVWVGDQDVTTLGGDAMRKLRLRFGMVFQHAALFDSMDVYQNVSFPLREHTKLDEPAIEARVREVLGLVGLSGAIRKLPSELSGGMKKRVGLARALVHTPEFLLYDEPTTGLDPILTAQIDKLILETQRGHPGMTSVVVSHDMGGAFAIADHIYMLHEGRIVASGDPEWFQTTDDPMVRQFVEGRLDGPIAVE